MKSILLTLFTVLIITITATAQESCSQFYPLEEGATLQYANYDKRGKLDGMSDFVVSDVNRNGANVEASFNIKLTDKKGKQLFETNYTMSCENGVVIIDYQSLFPATMLQQYSEMDVEMEISGSDIILPNNLEVGQELEDANVNVDINMMGIKMGIKVNQTNRKVEGKESVTVAAGTFDCYLLTENSTTQTMGTTIEMNSKLWLAVGVGMVKQESYKSNGNLMSSTELTKFNK